MNNFTTNVEYTGCNIDTLMEAGYDESNEFATFNQARKFWELSGKELKGAKACARLITIVLKKDKEGKEKKVPKYFSVFEKSELEAVIASNATVSELDDLIVSYKVKQINWDLVPNFDDRMSADYNDYYKITNNDASPELIELVKSHDDWYEVVEGCVKAHSLWGAYQEGNIGVRTFEGHSISTGDILIDEEGNQHLLTGGDFELVI